MLVNKTFDKKWLVAGIHAMQEALSSQKEFRKVFIQRDLKSDNIREIEKHCRIQHIPVVFVPKEKLSRMTKVVHQGIVGLLSPIAFENIENLTQVFFEKGINPVFVYLDRISDVRNFGAIVRSAVFCGINAIIIPEKGSADINDEAFKTSAGALLKIPVCRTFNHLNTIKYLKSSGFQVIAADEKANDFIESVDFANPTLVVMGSESEGIDVSLKKYIDSEVKIQGNGEFDSLNVSVAAGIVFYEILKQRK